MWLCWVYFVLQNRHLKFYEYSDGRWIFVFVIVDHRQNNKPRTHLVRVINSTIFNDIFSFLILILGRWSKSYFLGDEIVIVFRGFPLITDHFQLFSNKKFSLQWRIMPCNCNINNRIKFSFMSIISNDSKIALYSLITMLLLQKPFERPSELALSVPYSKYMHCLLRLIRKMRLFLSKEIFCLKLIKTAYFNWTMHQLAAII